MGEGLTWSPTHGLRCLPCRTRLGGRTRVSGHKAYQTVDRLQTPAVVLAGGRCRRACVYVPLCVWGGVWHTCLLHCCSALAHMARGSVCLVPGVPGGGVDRAPQNWGGGARDKGSIDRPH